MSDPLGPGHQLAHWVRTLLLTFPAGHVPSTVTRWTLVHARDGGITSHRGAVAGGEGEVLLTVADLPEGLVDDHPPLRGHLALLLPPETDAATLLQGQVAVAAFEGDRLAALTGVQIPLVLDDLFAAEAQHRVLGVTHHGNEAAAVAIWAPTAQLVELLTWPPDAGAEPAIDEASVHPLTRESDGTWTVDVPELADHRYLFRVTVFVPETGRVEQNLVTDPYSVALTLDSARSVGVDLADERWAPESWRDSASPRLDRFVDAAIYELHVRDFSMSDDLVPEALRGTYLAFAHDGRGARHLRRLQQAGLNTVHLLPTFDIATITENLADQSRPRNLERFAPASFRQQLAVLAHRRHDGFNWGYDPFHWMAPEGSYATSNEAADGGHRIAEFRAMVGALHAMGLRVVLDQVFNHTSAGGQAATSVLDRVVPGYHHRLDATGVRYGSTCNDNTATEHVMTGKMLIDACLLWVREHHVDGFRFDLMGHQPVSLMRRLRAELDALTLADDGVDGCQVHLYGEGWNFGEVADDSLFVQARQGNLDGSGIATFNDRIRDAVRGGRPFDHDPRRQGFASGAETTPNDSVMMTSLVRDTDLLQLGLAANLRDFGFRGTAGGLVSGGSLDYDGAVAGYASQPDEVLSYVDAHDNETLWDALTLKLPLEVSMADRIRHNTVALACVTLAQTPVLWHAGADLLRSKSLDRNSYNSGDWFNRLDWTGADNGFGRGLPPAADNREVWRLLRRYLRDPWLKPSADDVEVAAAAALDLLRLRNSSRLFRLGSADRIRRQVTFPLSGTPGAVLGVVACVVDDSVPIDGQVADPEWSGLLMVLNGRPHAVEQRVPVAGEWLLAPVQANGSDDVVKQSEFRRSDVARFRVPGRTASVFLRARNNGG